MQCASSHVFFPVHTNPANRSLAGKRKLKCSGEPTGCGRCTRQQLTCHYSAQKQMGRPRKRQKTNDESIDDDVVAAITSGHPATEVKQRTQRPQQPKPGPELDQKLTEKEVERTQFQNICNAAMAQTVKRSAGEARKTAEMASSTSYTNDGGGQQGSQTSSNTSPYDGPRTPTEGNDIMANGLYPTDVSMWPDFSDLAMLPVVVQDRGEREKHFHPEDRSSMSSTPGFSVTTGAAPYSSYLSKIDADPNLLGQLPTVPACPCLPNLYLTLSTLSTLSAFPVSAGMIDTLLNAHCTCRSVIYCPICPQKLQTGSQNVFLGTMLVTVLADHWHRVKKASAKELKTGFGSMDSDPDGGDPMNVREDLEWRTFGYHLIRAFAFGDQPIPDPPGSVTAISKRKPHSIPTHIASGDSDTSTLYTLNSLVQALERRQKQWHDVEPYHNSREFPPKLGHHPESHHHHGHGLPKNYVPGMTLEDIQKCEDEHRQGEGGDDGVLCLKIVKHTRIMMQSLEGDVPRVERGV